MQKPDFTKYYRYAELTEILETFSREFPTLCRLESIGKSHEGRDVWALTITATEKGDALEKPAMYVDGNIHGSEVTASTACLYIAWRLLAEYGSNDEITALVDGTTFYLIPVVSPDGVEFCLSTPGRVRSGTRLYPYEEQKDGLYPEDINGDGLILQMRAPDPGGAWKVSERDNRLMIPRAFHDAGETFYHIYAEGLIRNFDGVEVKHAPSKYGLDFNRNFPANWQIQSKQGGAGEYPFSEPETRAVGNFVLKHPNICGLHSFHTGFESIIRAPCTTGDKNIPREDLDRILDIGKFGKACTGYSLFSYNELYENIYMAHGDFATWAYDHLGLIYYCDELWDLEARWDNDPMKLTKMMKDRDFAGLEEMNFVLLKWNDDALGGDGFVNWRPFEHPQLGHVEIGGWKPLLTNNAPPHLLEETSENMAKFVFGHAKASPRLRVGIHAIEPLGDRSYHIAVAVRNDGYLPTSITQQAVNVGAAKPVEAILELPEGARLITGKEKVEIGHLGGYGGRKKIEWTVKLAEANRIRIRVASQKGGAVTLETNLL